MINNHVIDYIYGTHGHKILNWNHEILSPVNLQTYVNAITGRELHWTTALGLLTGR